MHGLAWHVCPLPSPLSAPIPPPRPHLLRALLRVFSPPRLPLLPILTASSLSSFSNSRHSYRFSFLLPDPSIYFCYLSFIFSSRFLNIGKKMPTFSTEQQQQLLCYGKNALLDLDVPPRKLLHRPGLTIYVPDDDQDQERKFNEEEKEIDEEEEGEEEEEVDTYSCDEFRMYEFKVRRCMRGRSHDWTDCPFAHPGEKARRRDPRRYHYSGTICPDFRRSGACPRGDFCEFAHGVFECWLHPARYRTMPCKDGRRCRRKVCFFAHSPSQLRRLPSPASATATTPIPSPRSPRKPSCCAVWTAASSPTSPLMGFSSPISPPISPSDGAFQLSNHTAPGNPRNNKNKNSTSSSCSGSYKGHGWLFSSGAMGYDSVLYEELTSSLEAMEISGGAAAAVASRIDGNSRRSSPSIGPIEGWDSAEQQSSSDCGGPDLEWVNELLM